MLESREHESLNWNTVFTAVQGQEEDRHYYESMHQENYKIQYDIQYPSTKLGSSDHEKMYFDQAMKHLDLKDLLNAAIREVGSNCKRKYWKLLPRAEVPKGQLILDSFWAIRERETQ